MSVCKWMTTRGTLTFCTITVELVPESSIAAKLLSPGFLFFFNNRHPSRGSPGSGFHNRLPHCYQTPAVTVRSWLAEVGGGLVEVCASAVWLWHIPQRARQRCYHTQTRHQYVRYVGEPALLSASRRGWVETLWHDWLLKCAANKEKKKKKKKK